MGAGCGTTVGGRLGTGAGIVVGGCGDGVGLTAGGQPGWYVTLGRGDGGSVGRPGCGGFDALGQVGAGTGLTVGVGRMSFGGKGVTLVDEGAVGRGLPCPEARPTSDGPEAAADTHTPAASNAVPPRLAAAMAHRR